jgi:glutathione synthase
MRFVYVMDPMQRLLPDKDTTVAMMRAAGRRGHVALHAELSDVFVRDGRVFARCRTCEVHGGTPFFRHGPPDAVALDEVDAVFVRKDPPFDGAYLYVTLLLECLRGKTLVVNDPRGLRDANEKLYTLHFTHLTPRTLVAADRDAIFEFLRDVSGKAIIKPLDGSGGAGVMMLVREDRNLRSIVDVATREGQRLAMVQEFLPAVDNGDKRVLLLDGQVLGAINRVPQGGDIRSNIHVGGRVEPCDVTEAERAIVAELAPRLRRDGLYFVGLDLIGGKLTEVNVTSPTGVQELSRHLGRDMADPVIAWVEKQVTSGERG